MPYSATKNHTFIDGSVAADLPMQRLSEIFNVNTFIVSQVNPFVIPFINDDGGGVLGTETTISKKIRDIINNEIVHVVNLMSSLGFLPEKVERVAGIATQNYKGHVTISPKVRFSDYMKILRNPSPEYVEEATKLSQQNTYPKIRLIKSIYEIENALNNFYLRTLESVTPDSEILKDIQLISPLELTSRQSSKNIDENVISTINNIKKSRSYAQDISKLTSSQEKLQSAKKVKMHHLKATGHLTKHSKFHTPCKLLLTPYSCQTIVCEVFRFSFISPVRLS